MAFDENGNPIEEPQQEEGVVEENQDGEEAPPEEPPAEPPVVEEEKFIDPDELPKELLPHFKRMQASFTRRMQKLSAEKEKVSQFDKLMADPTTMLNVLASRAGLKVVRPGETKLEEDGTEEGTETERWVRRIIKKELEASSKPILEEQAKLKVQATISYLNETHPDWTLYEDVMSEMVQKHPSLKEDVDTLYEISKMAVTKAENLRSQSQKAPKVVTKTSIGGRSTTVPKKAESIDEAFQIAKKKLGLP